MRLSELVSKLTPTTYTEIALVIFLIVFATIAVYVFSKKNEGMFEHARNIPLEDGGDE